MQGKWLTNSRVGWDGYIQITEQQNIRIKNDNVSLLICLFLLPLSVWFLTLLPHLSAPGPHLDEWQNCTKCLLHASASECNPSTLSAETCLSMRQVDLCVQSSLTVYELAKKIYRHRRQEEKFGKWNVGGKNQWVNILDKVIQCGWSA